MTDVKQRIAAGIETIKTLTGLSQADFDLLKKAAPEARQWGDEIMQEFYDTLYNHPRTAAVFYKNERVEREQTLIDWYHSLFESNDDSEFWINQTHIGLAHIRRHVHNQFMIGIAARMVIAFQKKAVKAFGVDHGLEVARAFQRVTNAVVGLTAEGYEELSNAAFSESTGAGSALIDRLIQQSIKDIEQELYS